MKRAKIICKECKAESLVVNAVACQLPWLYCPLCGNGEQEILLEKDLYDFGRNHDRLIHYAIRLADYVKLNIEFEKIRENSAIGIAYRDFRDEMKDDEEAI